MIIITRASALTQKKQKIFPTLSNYCSKCFNHSPVYISCHCTDVCCRIHVRMWKQWLQSYFKEIPNMCMRLLEWKLCFLSACRCGIQQYVHMGGVAPTKKKSTKKAPMHADMRIMTAFPLICLQLDLCCSPAVYNSNAGHAVQIASSQHCIHTYLLRA